MIISAKNLGKQVEYRIDDIWSKDSNAYTSVLIKGEIIGQLFMVGGPAYGYRCKFNNAPNKYFNEILFIDYSLPECKNLIGTPIEKLEIL